MIVPVTLAVAYALGVDPRRLLVLAAAVYLPLVVGALVILIVWKGRPAAGDRLSLFCEGVASELRAGASLRSALVTAATPVGANIPALGPLPEVAARVGDEFPTLRRELELTVVSAERSGADVAVLFDEMGAMALARSEIEREVRTAIAPGRATAILLSGAPLLYVLGRATSGTLGSTMATYPQRIAGLLGLGLFLTGLLLTVNIVWRSGK